MKKIRLLPLVMTSFLIVNIAFAADEIHWTITGQDSVTFDWRGTALENTIGYGLSPGAYTQITAQPPNPVPSSSKGPFWEAKLTGLQENTRYYYSIGNGPERTFHTAPSRGSSDFTIYAQGNIGDTTSYFNMGVIQDLIANDRPAFVIGLGDLTLGSSNGKAAIDQHFNDVMTWSKEAAYMPVWGDMEWSSSSADSFNNYKGRFDVPNSQTSPGSPLAGGEDWYWFDYGNTRFITLPEPWSGAWSAWNTKADALMTQAQTDPDIKYIVTFVHQPAYSSGHYRESAILRLMLDTLGDAHSKYVLNVNAHSNNYERSFPQHGVTHITAGTGGANLQQDGTCLWLTCIKPAWSAFRAMHLGALKLHFTNLGIEGSFICGPAGGGINDVNCTKGSVVDNFKISSPTVAPLASNSVTSLVVSTAPTLTALTAEMTTTTANLLGNPGFESGVTIWVQSGAVIGNSTSQPAHSGTWRAHLNGYGYVSTESLYQTVTIPATVTSATLSFWLHIDTAETTTSTAYDKLSVQVQNSSGTVLNTLATYSNLNKNTGYVQKSFDLSSYKGQTIRISFKGTEDYSLKTSFVLDDFLLGTGGTVTTPASDTTPPSVSISSPASASTISGTASVIAATASDNAGVAGVQFKIDGVAIGSEDTTSPYSGTLNTTLYSNGSHALTATARDAAGNMTTSTGVSVTVDNTTTAPPTSLGCATPAPTSSVVVNVRNTGARGDGSTDDTAAIQAAVNQVPAGGTVYIPDGIYMIEAVNTHVKLKSNMTLKMSSGAVLRAKPFSGPSARILALDSDTNVNIVGGTLDGNRAQHIPNVCGSWGTPTYCGEYGMGVSSYSSTNIYVEGVVSKNNWGDGFYFGGTAGGALNRNITLCAVTSDFNRRQGMSMDQVDGMTVKNSIFKNTSGTAPQAGIDLEPDAGEIIANVRILNSVFTGNAGPGIKLYNGGTATIRNITIDGNTVSGNTRDWGISTLNSTNSTITNNVVQNNWEGITLRSGTSGFVVNNNIVSQNSHANITNGGSGNTITNNDTTAALKPIPSPF